MPADGGAAPATVPVAPHPGRTTPLMYACSQGDLKQVQRILQQQPTSLHHLDRTSRTPLHYCAGGAIVSVEQSLPPAARLSHCADVLLMAAPDLVHARDQDGFTPLHLAVIAGNVQLVQFLLANGANVKEKDGEMHSVVHWATVCGETAALQAVLAAGAEVSTPDVHGGYPIHYAAQMCGSEKPDLGLQVLHILLSTPGISVSVIDNDGRQPLLWAASAGSARAVLALVRAGAAVEAADKDGLTALHCAASRGHTDTLDTLLTLCGAQTDVIDSNGCTALHYSVTLGHADATALLLSHSADPNLQDRKGRSPAHCGCAKGQLETVRQLHTAGANLWLRTARGDLPLHEAAASGRRQLVKWLLDQRPSQVNARNNDGRGLLHLAALNDNADMCKILLDSGAAINPLLRTSKNIFMTPLDCALQRGFRSTAKFLQLHGGVPANRLNTLRLSSEVASKVTSGSHLHIREDITIFGESSSETDVEDPHRIKDHRERKKTVRRKLSYKHERRRSYSGSDREVDKYRDKISMKYPHEKASRRSKSRDSALKKEEIYKSGKQIDIKSDGKQYRKKKNETDSEESLSETETSPEVKKDKTKTKISESERHRQKSAYKNETIENSKQNIQSDSYRKKSKKSHHDDSSYELSDTEKSRTNTSDRERRKSKNLKDEESQKVEQKSNRKTHSSNGEQEISDQDRLKMEQSSEEQLKQKSSDVEEKKKKKSKRSDISDSDNQKNKMSDTELQKKKTHKEESIEENVTEKNKLTQSHEKKMLQKQETLREEFRETVAQVEEKLQEQEVKTSVRKERTDSARSTKEKIDTRVSSAKHKGQISKSNSKSDEIKSSTGETSPKDIKDITVTDQEPDSKHIEDEANQTSKSIQPDQVSLQSKVSEESPSKTIVVEAAVHHPPKGISSEDVHEELKTVVEEKKEIMDETNKDGVNDLKETKIIEEKVADQEKNIDETLADKPENKQEVEDNKKEENVQIKNEEQTTQEPKIEEDKVETKHGETGVSEIKDDATIKDGAAIQDGVIIQDSTTIQNDATIKDDATAQHVTVQDGATVQNDAKVQDSASVQNDTTIQFGATDKDDATILDGSTIHDANSSLKNEEKDKKEDETQIVDSVKEPQLTIAISKEDKPAEDATGVVAEESSSLETKVTSETTEPITTTTEVKKQKKEDDSKKELNIDLSLKKFEETAEQNEASDVDENENLKLASIADETEESKHKKYRKKVKVSKTKDKDSKDSAVNEEESSSTLRETSTSDSESIKSTKKSKISDVKNGEHKSFKVLHDDVAFEVLKDSPVKEQRRVRKSSKKRAKETERLNESATSSPEMLESVRARSKSVPRHKDANLTLPSLVEKRPESNLSAPNLSSMYSDNEQKSGSNSEVDDLLSSASRKKRIKKRSRLRVGAKSAGSDYESSNLIDSGFEPSPRSSRIPKRKVMSERGVNMTSVTQQIQSNIRKYHMERKIFQHLLDLKRLQIRSGQSNEHMLVKRAIDHYHNSVAASVGAGRYTKKDFTYRSFEQFLYQSLRMLQKSPVDHMKGLPITPDNPLLCTQSTHRCLHATHAYTGIPCAAYLPKMNHHTIPKVGFTPRSSSGFLPQINSKGKSVTLELCHGNDKQVISLPADRLDHNKRYYVTFTVKGQDGPSPVDQENATSHRHAKSV